MVAAIAGVRGDAHLIQSFARTFSTWPSAPAPDKLINNQIFLSASV